MIVEKLSEIVDLQSLVFFAKKVAFLTWILVIFESKMEIFELIKVSEVELEESKPINELENILSSLSLLIIWKLE